MLVGGQKKEHVLLFHMKTFPKQSGGRDFSRLLNDRLWMFTSLKPGSTEHKYFTVHCGASIQMDSVCMS